MESAQPVSPAVNTPASTAPGQVAPSQPVQGADSTPGAARIVSIDGQPFAGEQQQTVAPGGQPQAQPAQATTTPPQQDGQAQFEAERQRRIQAEQQLGQYAQVMDQVRVASEQQQREQAVQREVQMALAAAEGMNTAEGQQYVQQRVNNLLAQQRMEAQQQLQQREQQFSQRERQIAAPQYADHLVQTLGLPADAKEELLALGDPDLMYSQAPYIKARYDRWSQMTQQNTNNQIQLGRSQEVNAMIQNGHGQFGGQGVGGTYQIEVSDDPDVQAMQILQFQERLERGGY